MRVFPILGVPVFHGHLTTATATGFPSTEIAPTTGAYIGKKARAALISAEDYAVRFTINGDTPTLTAGTRVGHLLNKDCSYEISGESAVSDFKVINAVDASGALLYYTLLF